MEFIECWKEKIRSGISRDNRSGSFRMGHGLVFLAYCLLVGCTTLKKSAIIAGSVGLVSAGSAYLGGATAQILAATTTAFVSSAVVQSTPIGSGNMSECVTGFWPMVGLVIEAGGWLLAGIILVPLIMGFLIPNGLERKRKRKT